MYYNLIVITSVLLVIKTEMECSLKKVHYSLIGHEVFILHIISDKTPIFSIKKGPI